MTDIQELSKNAATFLEQYGKNLETAGFTNAQALTACRIIFETKVYASAAPAGEMPALPGFPPALLAAINAVTRRESDTQLDALTWAIKAYARQYAAQQAGADARRIESLRQALAKIAQRGSYKDFMNSGARRMPTPHEVMQEADAALVSDDATIAAARAEGVK